MRFNIAKAPNYRSPMSATVHEAAAGLHRIGLVDRATMREFDRSCKTSHPAPARMCSTSCRA